MTRKLQVGNVNFEPPLLNERNTDPMNVAAGEVIEGGIGECN
jgi:hypothetical protein